MKAGALRSVMLFTRPPFSLTEIRSLLLAIALDMKSMAVVAFAASNIAPSANSAISLVSSGVQVRRQ